IILREMQIRPDVLLVETHGNESEVLEILESMDYQISEVVGDGEGQDPNCSHIRATKKRS
ncbi:MAG: hypothetical protein ABEI52_10835, partial [Halobacteriaceae archaeon]